MYRPKEVIRLVRFATPINGWSSNAYVIKVSVKRSRGDCGLSRLMTTILDICFLFFGDKLLSLLENPMYEYLYNANFMDKGLPQAKSI
jgi:hypothetical protein